MTKEQLIYWGQKKPSHEEIQSLLLGYIGAMASVQWSKTTNSWFVTFSHLPSHPLRHLQKGPNNPQDRLAAEQWFEIDLLQNGLKFSSKDQSPFLHAVVEGLIQYMAGYWKAIRAH